MYEDQRIDNRAKVVYIKCSSLQGKERSLQDNNSSRAKCVKSISQHSALLTCITCSIFQRYKDGDAKNVNDMLTNKNETSYTITTSQLKAAMNS